MALIGGIGGTLLVMMMMMRSTAQREAVGMPRRAAPLVAALMAAAPLMRGFGAPEWNAAVAWLWLAASGVTAGVVFGPAWRQAVRRAGSRSRLPHRRASPAPR